MAKSEQKPKKSKPELRDLSTRSKVDIESSSIKKKSKPYSGINFRSK